MVKLTGILENCMGGFLCLRGYASFQQLSKISEPNPSFQRKLIDKHKDEMKNFLMSGEYLFFPEIVLSLGFEDEQKHIELFYEGLQKNDVWMCKLGNVKITVSYKSTKDVNGHQKIIKYANLLLDETKYKLSRIDGNHRLSTATEIENRDFEVPFCLVIFRNKDENERYSQAIFHNINAKQIPLNLEENLKVIIDGRNTYSDDILKKDSSFGWEYYLARKICEDNKLNQFPLLNRLVEKVKYSFLVGVFDLLLQDGYLSKSEDAIKNFGNILVKVESVLKCITLANISDNWVVIGAITYYVAEDEKFPGKYLRFLKWIKENDTMNMSNVDIDVRDLIGIFDKIYENMPKQVFMSMKYSDETIDTYQTLQDVKDIIKRENNISFEIVKVDEHHDGYSDEIFARITSGIDTADLVVADLSYGSKNVHHEIGYAQGRGKKILLLYQERNGVEIEQEIGSNLALHDQVRYKNQTDLRPKLLKRIRNFFGIFNNEK